MFSAWFVEKMIAHGFNLRTIARQLETPPIIVSDWILGKAIPTDSECHIIATFFEVPLDEVRREAEIR